MIYFLAAIEPRAKAKKHQLIEIAPVGGFHTPLLSYPKATHCQLHLHYSYVTAFGIQAGILAGLATCPNPGKTC